MALTLDANKAVKAQFLPLYNITTSVSGKGSVGINPSQSSYVKNSVVSLVAAPQSGWRFVGWSGDLTGLSNPISLTVDSVKNLTANFLPLWQLSLSTNGSGGVKVSPLESRYLDGTVVSIEAQPEGSSVFAGWSGSTNSQTNPLILEFKTNTTLSANFLPTFRLVSGTVGAGNLDINPLKERYISNEVVTVTAKPSEGWGFVSWSGSASGSASKIEVRMSGDQSVSAIFKAYRTISVQDQIGEGSVQLTPAGGRYLDGTSVSALAFPKPGWTFLGWSGLDANKPNPFTVEMTADRILIPRFAQLFNITSKTNGNGYVSLSPSQQTYLAGDTVKASAVPLTGWRFVGWTGDVVGATNPVSVNVVSNMTVTAEFRREWSINATAGSGGSVSLAPISDKYVDGSVVSVTAVPQEGFEFAGWGGDVTNNLNPYDILVTTNRIIRANFSDAKGPVIALNSPISGVVGDGVSRLAGRVTDNVAVSSVYWELNSELQKPFVVDSDGNFAIETVKLVVGTNIFRLTAKDSSGKETALSVSVLFVPQRLLAVESVAQVQEGQRIVFPINLSSPGDVGGLTFKLNYDPALLADPSVELSSLVGQSVNSVNTSVAGEVAISFSLPGIGLPSGRVDLGKVDFRARSVPALTNAVLRPTIISVGGPNGSVLAIGNGAVSGSGQIRQRRIIGDNNANQRIDIGDAVLVSRLLVGLEETRPWDVGLNDLNTSRSLENGDVIKALRAVVGLDPQPSAGNEGKRLSNALGLAKVVVNTNDAMAIELLDGPKATVGQPYRVAVRLNRVKGSLSGLSFALKYPASLSLTDKQVGALVPGDALPFWNESSGQVSLAAIRSTAWANATGVAAVLTFVPSTGFSAQAEWPLKLELVEITGSGFDVRPVEPVSVFIQSTGGTVNTPPQIALQPPGADGSLTLEIRAPQGATVAIEATGDLNTWIESQSITGQGDTTPVKVTLKPDPNVQAKFWRVRVR